MTSDRGQATLVAFGVSLLVVTVTVGVAITVADNAFTTATRDPTDARIAASAADRLTAGDASITRRANVVNDTKLAALSAETAVELAEPLAGTAFRIQLGNRTLVERGRLTDGATSRRLVLVASETPRTRQIAANESVSLPRRTDRLRFDFANASVETVRAGSRVVLHDPAGLTGTVTVETRRLVTLRLQFDGNGTIGVTTYPVQTTKRELVVTVDAD